MVVHELIPPPDPVRCCELIAPLGRMIFFDSASAAGELGRYSFVMADPGSAIFAKGSRAQHINLRNGTSIAVESPLAEARKILLPCHSNAAPGLPPFQGGAAGYIAYDWGRTLEAIPAPPHDDLPVPDVALGIYDWTLAWDHRDTRAWLICSDVGGSDARLRADEILGYLRGTPVRVSDATSPWLVESRGGEAPSFAVHVPGMDIPGLQSSFTRSGYLDAVEEIRQCIHAGDLFQANLAQRFKAPLPASAWAFYKLLRQHNAAPFAAFLDFPEAQIASASPERFLKVSPDGQVETRPIKGTRPRGIGPEHDAHLGRALVESEKDVAENLMIVDLMRNDLSRVCRPGSVDVSQLFALEHYATVHHLVSTVRGVLAAGEDALSLIEVSFPGGSITGAPKIRSMEVISELEPSDRGAYCGAIGYWSVTGAMDTSVAIRTSIVRDGHVFFSAGGGIVADSEPTQEYRETLDKARGIMAVLAAIHGACHR